jgi:hypothetical protein
MEQVARRLSGCRDLRQFAVAASPSRHLPTLSIKAAKAV